MHPLQGPKPEQPKVSDLRGHFSGGGPVSSSGVFGTNEATYGVAREGLKSLPGSDVGRRSLSRVLVWDTFPRLSFLPGNSALPFSLTPGQGPGSSGAMGGPQGRTGRFCLEGGHGGGKRVGEWPPRLEFGLELSSSLSAGVTILPRGPHNSCAGADAGVRPRGGWAGQGRERAPPSPSLWRREARGEEETTRRRWCWSWRRGRGGEGPPRAAAWVGGGSHRGGGGGVPARL